MPCRDVSKTAKCQDGSASSSSPNPSSRRLRDEFYLRILLGRGWVQREVSRLCRAWLTRGYHWDSPGPGRLWGQGHPGADWEASSGNPFQAKTAAAPLLTQEGACQPFLGHSWCPPRRWQQGFVFPLHWSAVLSAGFFGWPQQSPSARDLPGLSQNHQPGLSRMTSRTEVGCSVPCQSPITWRDAAWPMPEPATGLWRPWETSALLLREIMCDLVSPPSLELWLAKAEGAYFCQEISTLTEERGQPSCFSWLCPNPATKAGSWLEGVHIALGFLGS